VLLGWVRERIGADGGAGDFAKITESGGAPGAFALSFDYGGGKSFTWTADMATGHATFDADFGTGRTVMPATAALLRQEDALSEAMFF
jgi:hypothetical protein